MALSLISSACPGLAEPQVLIGSREAGCRREGRSQGPKLFGLENLECAKGNVGCCGELAHGEPRQPGCTGGSRDMGLETPPPPALATSKTVLMVEQQSLLFSTLMSSLLIGILGGQSG